jgi:hypothetical protein
VHSTSLPPSFFAKLNHVAPVQFTSRLALPTHTQIKYSTVRLSVENMDKISRPFGIVSSVKVGD